MEATKLVLRRYSEPSKLDQAPEGTLCKVISSSIEELYIQRSSDEENPRWEKLEH